MSPPIHPLAPTLKALTFDLFGTVVDWRSSITTALTTAATHKLTSPTFSTLPQPTQARLQSLTTQDWAAFAQRWRDAYAAFTTSFIPGTTPWKDVDTLYRESLAALLREWGLAGVWDEAELDALSRSWHFLTPWPDVGEGMRRLNKGGFVTASLSNGNTALLEDLDAYAQLGLGRLISAEDFKQYKPSGEVYLGACRMLGLEPSQVAMVATHLHDLAAAREYGMRTVYVERPGEGEWKVDEERYVQAKEWVDVWVAEGEGGFEEVAKRLGA